MQEDLLGYLLGALEPDEMARVEASIRNDPELRRRLREIERSLKPLEDQANEVDLPSADLVSRTLDSLPPLPSPPASVAPIGAPAKSSGEPVVRLSEFSDRVDGSRWRWQDWMVTAVSAAVVLALFLPAIGNGRFEARKIACQDQLRRFGTAISQFVARSEHARLPAVNERGPEAFAGVYAVRLHESGLLDDVSQRWCPSFDLPSPSQPSPFSDHSIRKIATVDDLHAATVNQLRHFQRFAGGHYAYTLGVRDEGQFLSPKYEQRFNFAVMSDAPVGGMMDARAVGQLMAHGGHGLNILYEDGHVRFISVNAIDEMIDHPWLNHRGNVEAGVTVDDASLAPSWRPPFVHSPQR